MAKVNLSKRLQYFTISPLIIGIVFSALCSVAIMFVEHLSWLNTSRDDLRDHDMKHFEYVSNSFADSFTVLVDSVRNIKVTFSLVFIAKTYEGVQQGTLKQSQVLDSTFVRFEEASGKFN
jgi:hypothetical protein